MANLNDLLFPVRIENETMNCNTEYSKRVLGTINGEDFLLNQCSDRYELVPNSLIFPKIEEVLNNGEVKFSSSYQSKNNVRFYGDYVIESNDFALAIGEGGDLIKPVIKVRHSYNGLTKYTLTVGFFRIVCSNGLVIPFDLGKEFNLHISGKHTPSILNSVDNLMFMVENLTNSSKAIKVINDRFNILADKKINNVADRIEKTLKVVGIDSESKTELQTNERGTILQFVNNVIEKEKRNWVSLS